MVSRCRSIHRFTFESARSAWKTEEIGDMVGSEGEAERRPTIAASVKILRDQGALPACFRTPSTLFCPAAKGVEDTLASQTHESMTYCSACRAGHHPVVTRGERRIDSATLSLTRAPHGGDSMKRNSSIARNGTHHHHCTQTRAACSGWQSSSMT